MKFLENLTESDILIEAEDYCEARAFRIGKIVIITFSIRPNSIIPPDIPFIRIISDIIVREQKFTVSGTPNNVSRCWLNNNSVKFPSVGLNTGRMAYYGQVITIIV